jgi:hypothetical protein
MQHSILVFNYVDALSAPLLSALESSFQIHHLELVDVSRPTGSNADYSLNYHDPNTLHYGEYNTAPDDLIPLEPSFILKMVQFESQALRMLDRGRKPGKIRKKIWASVSNDLPTAAFISDDLSYDERRRIYFRHLRYWHHVIVERQISLYLSVNVPHIVYDYIAYAVCKTLGVKTIFFERPFAPGIMFPRENFEDCINLPKFQTESPVELSKFHEDFLAIQKQRSERTKAKSSGWRVYLSNEEMQSIFYAGDPPSLTKTLFRGISAGVARLSLKRFKREFFAYLSLRKHFQKWRANNKTISRLGCDFDVLQRKRYIYLPLHYQPESSTSPLAGAFVDQLLMVDMLAWAVPSDVLIAVKEHPAQTSVARDPEYYRDIKMRRNVRLMRTEVDTYRLISNSIAVATANGTAGWEAFCRNKPVLVFGLGIQGQAPAGFSIQTKDDCRSAIENILSGRYDSSVGSLRKFLSRMEKGGMTIYTDDSTLEELRQSGISENSTAKAIVGYVKSVYPG